MGDNTPETLTLEKAIILRQCGMSLALKIGGTERPVESEALRKICKEWDEINSLREELDLRVKGLDHQLEYLAK